jgi:hypothetical protein
VRPAAAPPLSSLGTRSWIWVLPWPCSLPFPTGAFRRVAANLPFNPGVAWWQASQRIGSLPRRDRQIITRDVHNNPGSGAKHGPLFVHSTARPGPPVGNPPACLLSSLIG